MELKLIEKELLIKSLNNNDDGLILTHGGFINNCGLSKGEIELLNNLAIEMKNNKTAIVLNNKVFSPYVTGYDGGIALAGIQISAIYNTVENQNLRKAYEIGRTDSRISEREGKYYDTFDEWFYGQQLELI
jgi:hypothetical protein